MHNATMTIYLSHDGREGVMSMSLDGQDPPKPGQNVVIEGLSWTVAGIEIEVPWRMQEVLASSEDARKEGGN